MGTPDEKHLNELVATVYGERIKLATIYYMPLNEPNKYVMEMADGVVEQDLFAQALRGIADNLDRNMGKAIPGGVYGHS